MLKKNLFLLLCAVSALLSVKAYADSSSTSISSSSEDPHGVVGSFIGQRGTTPDDARIDQLVLHEDHTAYVFQTNALVFPITTGTFAPQVGTWKICDDRLIVTTVGFFANPACAPCCCDLNIAGTQRLTQEFEFIDCNTLRVVHRVERNIPFDEDPLTAEGEIVLDSFAQFDLRRVHAKPSDLNGDVSCSCTTSSSCTSESSSSTTSSTTCSTSSSSSTSSCEEEVRVKEHAHRHNK